ncbi:MAG: glycosyltransferase family 2 protein [Verrucomicrobiae bacterium]|nr:glycosyltransferase family 2 protein [Verrucomicrobiae bacterium]MCP5539267.1 glycosyltransferase family 2 protein [Akkermansiaceae bacterium]
MTRYLRERTLFGPLIAEPPPTGLGLVVTLPAKNEGESLIRSLMSLRDCDTTAAPAEIIVVVNTSETDPPAIVSRNAADAAAAREWAAKNSTERRRFYLLEAHGLPRKHAGVGLARKIAMDEACRRLEAAGQPRGAIACFDADSRCDPNYLAEVEALFRRDESCQAGSVYFEHPLEGDEFSPAVYDAIAHYELHLRVYVNAQKWAGFPFATQTIGSSMAVRADAYQAQNGMNKRQAGEDFYFLHKFTPLGRVVDLNTTRVIPSPRVSHRVPFGTGRAVADRLAAPEGEAPNTHAPDSFRALRTLFERVDDFRTAKDTDLPTLLAGSPEPVRVFLEKQDFAGRLEEIRANTTDAAAFRARFFRWFNAFLLMKFVHFARDGFFPDVPVVEAARWLLETRGDNRDGNARELLERWRRIDRSGAEDSR